MAELSPMMQQYFRIKESHQDHLLFFRLGDFYEMFFEDALTASKELGLTLTGRDCGQEERAPMCGVPYHARESYIARLIKKGYKVAICEQMEDPAAAKGVVSREVVRVVTPGTVLENNLLEEDVNNYLCCLFQEEGGVGLVFADVTTGELNLVDLAGVDEAAIIGELGRYMPREFIFNPAFLSQKNIAKFLREKLSCSADLMEEKFFSPVIARERVEEQFGKESLDGLGEKPRCVRALGALLQYLGDTQKVGLERLCTLNVREGSRYMALDQSSRTNLELLQTLRSGEKRGSLLWVLDKTRTPMGKRLLRSWIVPPLMNPVEIEKRLSAVEELFQKEILAADVEESLAGVFDLERLMTRIVYGNASPREYKTLEQGLGKLPGIKELIAEVTSGNLAAIRKEIDPLGDIKDLLARAVREDAPANLRDGGVIADGYSRELDGLRELVSGSKGVLARMESEEREKTGIKNLKIGYNKVFGYYIEVTKSNLAMAPDSYIRKQTLANCERYITPELKELEERLLTASEKTVALEHTLFEEMRLAVAAELPRIQTTATALARLDVYTSLARAARENRYVRPEVNLGGGISIRAGRHPVVERLLTGAPFVPNDTELDGKDRQITVITGPNMGGKSTYMRQSALIVLMAQIGSFVPAESAVIGVTDGIYTRIGASDDLSAGQSTFMVEMVEVADILKKATSRSLLLLDEIGRGTSTYDGMSIARAVLEYVAGGGKLGAKTLFATHYHELTAMEESFPMMKNLHVAVKKRGEGVTFLYKIVAGGADDSYGVEVAALAGIPDSIVRRAHEILDDLEENQPVRERKKARRAPPDSGEFQITFDAPPSGVEARLREIDPSALTPIEALNILYQLRETLGK